MAPLTLRFEHCDWQRLGWLSRAAATAPSPRPRPRPAPPLWVAAACAGCGRRAQRPLAPGRVRRGVCRLLRLVAQLHPALPPNVTGATDPGHDATAGGRARCLQLCRSAAPRTAGWCVVHVHVEVREAERLLWADKAASRLFARLVAARRQLEEIAACVSTLGGAHAALGDGSAAHAWRAEALARRQHRVALALGDARLAAKCRLFVGFSALQRGQHRRALGIIHAQALRGAATGDAQLRSMALAGYDRLLFLQAQAAQNPCRCTPPRRTARPDSGSGPPH